MKFRLMMIAFALAMLVGCGGGGGAAPVKKAAASGIPNGQFKVVVCTEDNTMDYDCSGIEDIDGFDLSKYNVLVLKAPDDIGTSQYFYFEGRRFGLVPEDETDISPKNMLAYGLVLFAKDAKEQTELIRRLHDYDEAIKFLEELGITGTDGQNEAILEAINYNIELIGAQGIPVKQAYDANIKAMAGALVNLTEKGMAADFTDMKPLGLYPRSDFDGSRVTLKSTNLEEIFLISKKDAFDIGAKLREKSDKPNAVDGVFKELACKDNEDMQIYMYGAYDSFNATNPEATTLSAALATALSISPYLGGYDEPASMNNIKIFADTSSGLPTNLTQGIYAIGLKETGIAIPDHDPVFVDKYYIGDLSSTEFHEGNVSTLRSTWSSPASDVYFKNLSAIMTANGQSLLSVLQGGQSFLDTVTMVTTNVDFIAIGACIPKEKPTETPVEEIPTKLECNPEKGEELLTIWGGTSDDFAQPVDATTPSAAIVVWQGNNANKYDAIMEKTGRFGDTLGNPNSHISQLELLINTRPKSGTSGAANDKIFMGDVANELGAVYDPNAVGIATPNGGTAHLMYGGDTVYDNAQNASGTLLSLMNTNNTDLDVLAFQQTEVDTIRLSMCVVKDYVEPCPDSDGDGVCDADDCDPKDPTVWVGCDDDNDTTPPPVGTCNQSVSLDLRPASSWVDASGANPTENNVFATYPPRPELAGKIWDGTMNWFDYGSAGNAVHPLSIDYCACGDGSVTIDELKSDNFSKIYLDTDPTPPSFTNPAYIASRSNGTSQDTMASWGSSESGYLSMPFSSSTPVDHTLHFDVKNGFGPAGGAVDGTLEFIGHLGKCTDADVVGMPVDDNDSITVNPDLNWTVVTGEGTVAVITDIEWVATPDTPVGTEGNGTIVIGIAGPIISTNPGGKPFVDNDPEVVVDLGNIDNVGLSDGALVAIDHLVNPPQYTRDEDTQIVTDHSTNLQWQDDDEVINLGLQKRWLTFANYSPNNYYDTTGDTAATYCDNLTLGTYSNWRLPTNPELLGIVNYATSPTIDSTVFQYANTHNFWSSTTHSIATHALSINFSNGNVETDTKVSQKSVRCVRDGQ